VAGGDKTFHLSESTSHLLPFFHSEQRRKKQMKLKTSNAFVLLLKEKNYNIPQAVERCYIASQCNIPMYLIVFQGIDMSPVADFPWRPHGIFTYRHDLELIKIWRKIQSDLKWIKDVGT